MVSNASTRQIDAAPATLGFADVSAFARQPEDDEIRAEDRSRCRWMRRERSIAYLRHFGIVAGVGAVDRHGAEPEPRRDHFGGDPVAVEALPEFLGFVADLLVRFAVDVRHGVVVVEHHGVEAELL